MENIRTLLTILGYIFLGTVGAASIAALFRSRYIKASMEELRNDRDDLQKRTDRLEKERDDLEKSNIARDVHIKDQAQQIATLRDALSGKAQLDHLQKQLDAHDKRVDGRHDETVKLLRELLEKAK